MITTLIEIGRSMRDVYKMPLVEVPYPEKKRKNPPRVLVVELTSNGKLTISGVSLLDYTPNDSFEKYYFRRPPSSQGPAASLSFKLPGKPSALRQRLGILSQLNYTNDVEELAEAIEEEIERLDREGTISKTAQILIVLKIDGKWPAENERLRAVFEKNFMESLSNYKKKPIWKTVGICHGCGKKTTVYGGVGSLLKFYTVDKYGYAPELNPKIAWKQYALCEDCIFDLERGKRTVNDFLTWQFYGKTFWMLPVTTGDLQRILKRFKNFREEVKGKIHKEGYESFEDRLLYEASIQDEAISYHFVFLKEENQALRIKLHIEEVLPSILKNYINTKRELEDEFKDFINEAFEANKVTFNFFSSMNLKATNQKPGFTDEDFYILVDKVFRRSPVDENYLISKAMSRIRKDLAESGEQGRVSRWSILEILLSLEFLLKWGILKRKFGGIEMIESPYYEFFERHGDFFDHPSKRALVLLGVLVQKFLDYQYSQRGSTPFLKILKNLKLNQKDVQSIFTKLQNKMNEYDIGHWWPELRKGISLYFIDAGDRWPLAPDEIGFYIAVGMALHSHPIFGKRKSGEEGEIRNEE